MLKRIVPTILSAALLISAGQARAKPNRATPRQLDTIRESVAQHINRSQGKIYEWNKGRVSADAVRVRTSKPEAGRTTSARAYTFSVRHQGLTYSGKGSLSAVVQNHAPVFEMKVRP